MDTYVAKIAVMNSNDTGVIPIASTMFGICNSGSTDANKVVNFSQFDQLVSGVTIHVRFTYGNVLSDNLTLRVGSTTSLPISGNCVCGLNEIIAFTYEETSANLRYWRVNASGISAATEDFIINTIRTTTTVPDLLIFKGGVGRGGNPGQLPTSGYATGWTYRVVADGTFLDMYCKTGDLIIAVADAEPNQVMFNTEHWTIIQSKSEFEVSGPGESEDKHVVIFNGTSGQSLADSGFTIESSVPPNAVFTDTVYEAGLGLTLDGEYLNVDFGTNPTLVATGNHSHGNINNDGSLEGALLDGLVSTYDGSIIAGPIFNDSTSLFLNGAGEWSDPLSGILPISHGGTGTEELGADLVVLTNNQNNTVTAFTTRSYIDADDAEAFDHLSTAFVTERKIYYGLPSFNGAHTYTSDDDFYVPTEAGDQGALLIYDTDVDHPIWTEAATLSSEVGSSGETVLTLGSYSTSTSKSLGFLILLSSGLLVHKIEGMPISNNTTEVNHFLLPTDGYLLLSESAGNVGSSTVPIYINSDGIATAIRSTAYRIYYGDNSNTLLTSNHYITNTKIGIALGDDPWPKDNNVDIPDVLYVNGKATINDDTNISGDINITGDATIEANISITGTSTLSSYVGIGQNPTLSYILGVTGNSLFTGDIDISGDLEINTNLYVAGTSELIGRVSIGDDLETLSNGLTGNILTITGSTKIKATSDATAAYLNTTTTTINNSTIGILNFIPENSGYGEIGTSDNKWKSAYFSNSLTIDDDTNSIILNANGVGAITINTETPIINLFPLDDNNTPVLGWSMSDNEGNFILSNNDGSNYTLFKATENGFELLGKVWINKVPEGTDPDNASKLEILGDTYFYYGNNNIHLLLFSIEANSIKTELSSIPNTLIALVPHSSNSNIGDSDADWRWTRGYFSNLLNIAKGDSFISLTVTSANGAETGIINVTTTIPTIELVSTERDISSWTIKNNIVSGAGEFTITSGNVKLLGKNDSTLGFEIYPRLFIYDTISSNNIILENETRVFSVVGAYSQINSKLDIGAAVQGLSEASYRLFVNGLTYINGHLYPLTNNTHTIGKLSGADSLLWKTLNLGTSLNIADSSNINEIETIISAVINNNSNDFIKVQRVLDNYILLNMNTVSVNNTKKYYGKLVITSEDPTILLSDTKSSITWKLICTSHTVGYDQSHGELKFVHGNNAKLIGYDNGFLINRLYINATHCDSNSTIPQLYDGNYYLCVGGKSYLDNSIDFGPASHSLSPIGLYWNQTNSSTSIYLRKTTATENSTTVNYYTLTLNTTSNSGLNEKSLIAFANENTNTAYINTNIDSNNGFALYPYTTNKGYLGLPSTSALGAKRLAGVYIGTEDTHGTPYQPIYWNDGVPTKTSGVVLYNEFTIAQGTHSVTLSHDAYKPDGDTLAYVLQIVVTSGVEYLSREISWTSNTSGNNGTITLDAHNNVADTVTGYIITARGINITPPPPEPTPEPESEP